MHSRVRAAIARIDVVQGGQSISRGTGFLVAEGLVLTALHVVADRRQESLAPYPGEIVLTFPNHSTTAVIHGEYWDRLADWVLLKCAGAPPARPIPLAELRESGAEWQTYGFPDASPRDGMVQVGEVSNHLGELEGQAVFQLFSREAAAGQGAPVKGLSGSPVLVEDAVVGLLRFALMKEGQTVAGTVYACPIASVLKKVGPLLPLPDPCFGLPGLPVQPLPSDPYRYLARFTDKDAEVFFGRNREIRQLYDRLTADAPPLTLLYGQSGVGKSSFLDAGLAPRLRWHNQVLYLRRDHQHSLLETLQVALAPAAIAAAAMTTSTQQAPGLFERWKALEQRNDKPLMVFFDQIEEVYTLPCVDAPNELPEFVAAVKEAFADTNAALQGRLVLSFRKEWFPEIQKQVEQAGLNYAKVFLEGLDHDAIIEVVNGLTQTQRLRDFYNVLIAPALPEAIAQDLLADRNSPIAPTLQILLTRMWRKAASANGHAPQMTVDLYRGLREDGLALGDFLDQQIAELAKSFSPEVESGLALDILAYHTTPLLTSKQRLRAELLQTYAHRADVVPGLVAAMGRQFLLSDASSDSGDKATRLMHDTLAPLVRQRFDQSDKIGQRARRIMEARTADWDGSDENALDAASLTVMKRGMAGMRALKPREQELVEASERKHAKDMRASRLRRLAAIAAVVAVAISAGISFVLYLSANNERKRADKAREVTDLQLKAATLQDWLTRMPLSAIISAIQTTGESLKTQGKVIPQVELALSAARIQAIEATQIPADGVQAAAISPDGLVIATMRVEIQGRSMREVLEFRDSQLSIIGTQIFPGSLDPSRLNFSPDGNLLAIIGSGSSSASVIWNRQKQAATNLAAGPIVSAFTPDGRYLLTGHANGLLRSWTPEGRQLMQLQVDQGGAAPKSVLFPPLFNMELIMNSLHQGKSASLRALATATFNGETVVATGGDDGHVRLWKMDRWNVPWKDFNIGHRVTTLSLAVRGGELLTAVGDLNGGVQIWNAEGRATNPFFFEGFVRAVAFSPNTNLLAAASSNGLVSLLSFSGVEAAPAFRGLAQPVTSLAFFRDDNRLLVASSASSGKGGSARILDLSRLGGAQRVTALDPLLADAQRTPVIAAVPLAGGILVAGTRAGDLHLWSRDTDSVRRIEHAVPDNLTKLSASLQGTVLAAGGRSGRIWLFNPAANPIAELTPPEKTPPVSGIVFSPDGRSLAVSHENGDVAIWDLAAKRRLTRVNAAWSRPIMAFTAASDRLAVVMRGSDASGLRFWRFDGTATAPILAEDAREITALAFRPDGQGFVTSMQGGGIARWTMDGKAIGRPVGASKGTAIWLACDRESKRFFFTDISGPSVGSYPPNDQVPDLLGLFQQPFPISSAALSPEEDTIVTVDSAGIRLWPTGWRTALRDSCDRIRGHSIFRDTKNLFRYTSVLSPEAVENARKVCEAELTAVP